VHLSAGLKSRLGNLHIHVSISHSTDYATAVAIWE
jgi:phosphopantetheinyl transferase (holo-ACP synthase)